MKQLGLYIHIPFCVRKCRYCDFLSFPCGEKGTNDEETRLAYTEALIRELTEWGARYGKSAAKEAKDNAEARQAEQNARVVDSVFFGGGTPSLLEPYLFERAAACIRQQFAVAEDCEWTVEVNPGTVTAETLQAYRKAGVNRLSIGCQSLNDDVLHAMGRIHTAEDFRRTYARAREAGFTNINCDLIFAVPWGGIRPLKAEENAPSAEACESKKAEEQAFCAWQQTLEEMIALKPEHLSFYALQIEEKTPFGDAFENGRLVPVSDETDRAMYHRAVEMLQQAGYHHYEISNAAKPGFESRHNLKYWSMEDYLGIGLGASSCMRESDPNGEKQKAPAGPDAGAAHERNEGIEPSIRFVRWKNTEDMETYLQAKTREERTAERTVNTAWDTVSDFFFTGLRKVDGVDLKELESLADLSVRQIKRPDNTALWDSVEKHIREGLLALQGDRLRFTARGLDLANTVLIDFV